MRWSRYAAAACLFHALALERFVWRGDDALAVANKGKTRRVDAIERLMFLPPSGSIFPDRFRGVE
jgi:hypothetical protein